MAQSRLSTFGLKNPSKLTFLSFLSKNDKKRFTNALSNKQIDFILSNSDCEGTNYIDCGTWYKIMDEIDLEYTYVKYFRSNYLDVQKYCEEHDEDKKEFPHTYYTRDCTFYSDNPNAKTIYIFVHRSKISVIDPESMENCTFIDDRPWLEPEPGIKHRNRYGSICKIY